ncbi:MAG TPA: leucine--tRNA ligase [Candidatus Dormibacteraeota bacterium]|nr:leucine--tRNA ligase [Candidatus Dormibacteraeota bacterium]
MNSYNPKTVESKWQKIWEETGLYKTETDKSRHKFYCLVMFPYPSGDLHSGHWYCFGPSDTFARFNRMQGKKVLHPIGFDAFGLPAENAAIKRDIAPAKWTAGNVKTMTAQLKSMGAMYDWSKSIDTSRPEYYRWTQWLFLKLYEQKLAYRAKGWQNWCPSCQTVLANEQVIGPNNECERCGTPVTKKELEQWFFKITEYADRLLEGLEEIEWPEKIKQMQRNWIGRSVGAELEFKIEGSKSAIKVFTTRADTIYGATYMVLAPEHELVGRVTTSEHQHEVEKYTRQAASKSEVERMDTERAKTGVFTGAYAINPATKEKIPVWVADYVLAGYGTGAIMAVPAHDERDYEFAKKFDLTVTEVIKAGELPYSGEGEITNSGEFDGQNSAEAREKMTKQFGREKVNYKMRDWLISRQRYWGAPIPIVYCDTCGTQPVPEDQLPVELPLEVKFKPTGKSPLSESPDFYEAKCPKCKGPARRETDTMDTFVDSSWYFLRYPDPNNNKAAFDKEKTKHWLPVDQYIGGVEHAILHLLYARFITKVLHDAKEIEFNEPFKRLFNQGLILGPDGQKMSKSRGNVINPDDWVGDYGADTFRIYLMFMGPYEQGGPFNPSGIDGTKRFLNRVWVLTQEYLSSKDTLEDKGTDQALEAALASATHKTLKKVTEDLQVFGFNTAIAAQMELVNEMYKLKKDLPLRGDVWQESLEILLKILAPFAPHITEELWQQLGHKESIHITSWPVFDEKLTQDELIEVVVQINGKVRAALSAAPGASQADIVELAKAHEAVQRHTEDKKIIKEIYVPDKLVNFVVKE